MKKLVKIGLFCLALNGLAGTEKAQGQSLENKEDTLLRSAFSIGFSITPTYILNPEILVFGPFMGYELSNRLMPMTYQIDAGVRLSERLSLLGSVGYAQQDLNGTYYCHVCDLYLQDEPERIKFRFIEVPLVLRMQFGNGALRTHAQAGFGGNFFLNEIITDLNGVLLVDRRANVNALAGFGLNYEFFPGFKGLITAQYSHKLFGQDPLDFRTVGLNAGILYQLK